MGIIAIFGRKLLRRGREQSRKLRAGGSSHRADAIGIDGEVTSLGAYELHSRFDVVYGAGIGLHAWLHQPVIDCEYAKAVAREVIAPVRVELASADLPPAAMNRDRERRPAEPFWQVKIANEPGPVMLRELDVVVGAEFELACHGILLHSSPPNH